MNRILLSAALSIILFTGCKKSVEEPAMPHGIYLTRIKFGDHSGQYRTFEYNSAGRIAKQRNFIADQVVDSLHFQYDGSRLTQINLYSIRSFLGEPLYADGYMMFKYQDDRIIKTGRIPSGLIYSYEYDDQKRITQTSATGFRNEFYYDSSGNVSRLVYWNLYNGTSVTTRYFYDDKINPTYGVDLNKDATFGEIDVMNFACPNNAIKSVMTINADTVSVSEFDYTYNSDNLPLTSVEHYKDKSNSSTIYLGYTYESR